MSKRTDDLLVYVPIVIMLFLIGASTLVWLGPTVGGGLEALHGALRNLLAGDDRVVADTVQALDLSTAFGPAPQLDLPSVVEPAATPPMELPVPPNPNPAAGCAAAHFETSIGIEGGYASFGRFSLVTDTDPFGRDDPLTAWKLLQFGGFPLDLDGVTTAATAVPVDEVVNLLISDPYSQDMLFSARWRVEEITVQGHYASINVGLQTNLDGFGVDNAIESPTLESLATAGEGVLTMGFSYGEDIVEALLAGRPVYAKVTGTIYPAGCLR
jgi:hypothetical protein